jgi:hypothetical protein
VCDGNYAAATLHLANWGAVASFRAVGGRWVVLAGANILPRTGLPPAVYSTLLSWLNASPQTYRFTF